MIQMSELLGKYSLEDQSQDVQNNLALLLARINQIRAIWGNPMTVTSGLRTVEDQLRIYAAKGITDPAKIPMGSEHLKGGAVDIYDPDKSLQAWCKDNVSVLEQVQFWMEDFSATPNWVHFQVVPPKSGQRWFMP